VLDRAEGVDLVIIAGDLLDASGGQPTALQVAAARTFIAELRRHAAVVVCSGNHDLDGIDEHGERTTLWNRELADLAVVDGGLLELGDTVISVCPWWDGPRGADRLRAQLDAQATQVGLRRWIWVHHAPAAGSRTAWDGRRDCGDSVLAKCHATPPNSKASAKRSIVESKNAPRWLEESDAFASAPSSRSGKAASTTSNTPRRSEP
ncbi:MAG: metallophosphoesterase, partial [Ilumatobacteraceae bacterium]